MARYTPRHAPRHAAPRRRGAAAVTALGRPVVTTGVLAAVAAGGVAVSGFSGDSADADSPTFAVGELVSSVSSEESRVASADADRLAADRASTNSLRAVEAAEAAEEARKKAAELAKQREEEAERAARAAERKRIFQNAQDDPKAAAQLLLPEYGFGSEQWSCLDRLWIGESDWRWWVANPSSGAYGIPQSLPAEKMATAGADWRTNPVTQIEWGLDYIKRSYGTPCNALSMWESRSPHWY
ncbi:hypothetical protein KC207_10145 [Phycicoccus sp. BSK3Z-2]|uniref:Lytic transglycosylase domain-containing protein n=1 Tax=Phycicoccus avicenniae TaxID=2828860 RepID=A0A941D8D5_9MICO|nr:hypothetical protein [Phycicoccus avicenniae]MBR7743650.1 hypothetical protein [Phycicoccus avicenniae]